MNLDQLGHTFQANRTAILGAGAAGVVGLALYRKHQAGAAGAAGDAAATVAGASAGGQVAGMTGAGNTYDSSASDLYGAIQPQLESIGGQITDLNNRLDKVPVAAPPKTAPTPAPKPAPKPTAPKAAPKPAPKPAPVPAHHPAPPPPPVPVAAPKHAVDTWVTVNKGDSLSKIAARYPQQDITWQSIARDNGVKNPSLIYAGQRFHVVG